MLNTIRPALVLLTGFTLLTGIAYPLLVTGIAGVVMPSQAGGSLITDNGKIIGSSLIAQNFTRPEYFHPRPSAASFNASASSGSNLAPGSADLAARITASIADLRASGTTGAIPADLVTTSASGLDPDITPAAATAQTARIAAARNVPPATIAALITAQTRQPLLGEPQLNVLALNRALDSK